MEIQITKRLNSTTVSVHVSSPDGHFDAHAKLIGSTYFVADAQGVPTQPHERLRTRGSLLDAADELERDLYAQAIDARPTPHTDNVVRLTGDC